MYSNMYSFRQSQGFLNIKLLDQTVNVTFQVSQVMLQGRMKHGGKSGAESQLKHFTKKLTVPSLYLTDNPLH